MAHEELLTEFSGLLDQYAKHRDYIDKAQAQAEKFSKAVIEKVILDHEVKSATVADSILPIVPKLLEAVSEIDAAKAKINEDKAGADEAMEELLLRQTIGELSEEEFEAQSADLRATLDSAADRLAELDADREKLQGAIDRWAELAARAGVDSGIPADEPVVEDVAPSGQREVASGMREDVSAVFDDNPVEQAVAATDSEVSIIEAADAAEDAGDEPSADVDFGFDDGDDFLAEADGAEVQLDLVGDEGPADADEEIAVDLDGDLVDEPATGGEEEPRRALLLYQEGTAEEQIYPFTGEVLTIGRGRDNDIQIKNDSKVSRFHCRLFRRGGNFYIEDNKSSNGTLVNGELITERRLFGGEEVIIGETFFRFRIM
ncbi:MAG: FHA domain-containing protein [Deltaproteobacteria bacterium]|nr:MAG: FHA domain-containing protein [Deltaproteobacteria bacterium]